jgi:hypothetical protein
MVKSNIEAYQSATCVRPGRLLPLDPHVVAPVIGKLCWGAFSINRMLDRPQGRIKELWA